MIENVHRIPEPAWTQWTPRGQQACNEALDALLLGQSLMLHPSTPRMTRGEWIATARRIALCIGDAVSNVPINLTRAQALSRVG